MWTGSGGWQVGHAVSVANLGTFSQWPLIFATEVLKWPFAFGNTELLDLKVMYMLDFRKFLKVFSYILWASQR